MPTFTDPNGGAVLPTEVIYPATGSGAPVQGHHPLIVFAEGFLALPDYYSGLLDSLAKAGFVVAAPKFPGTSGDATPPVEADDLSQPADVNFVIASLLTLNHSPNNPLQGLLDPSAIGLAGHSDGGDAVSAVSYNTCCYSSRIGATAILSGAELPGLPAGSAYFTTPNPSPLLVVQGQQDSVNKPSFSDELYAADTTGPKYYLSMANGTHWTPYSTNPVALTLGTGLSSPSPQTASMAASELPVVEEVITDFFEAELVPGTKTPAQITSAGTVSGTSTIVSANLGSGSGGG